MPDVIPGADATPSPLPDAPNLNWLRKEAKRQLAELRRTHPLARLADAQLAVARRHGFPSWRALRAHIDSLTVAGQLFTAAAEGDVRRLTQLLDAHPDQLHARKPPYAWTLLHVAASRGQLAAVDLLLRRGLDVNARERGDDTYAMHWAAAAGHLEVVRRLADAGGDVVGEGDDHQLEVIGWATCWDGCDDDAHRAVAELLVERGARHHIFSAIAMNLPAEVRGIVAERPAALHQRMSRNENHQLPLHFAVGMRQRAMVELLVELGADPLGVDGSGFAAPVYSTTPDVDLPVMHAIRAMTSAELTSSRRGRRAPNLLMMDLLAALALGDLDTAGALWKEAGGSRAGVLHLMAKRGDARAVAWLLERGADPNERWAHWDAEVTPLHLAALGRHPEIAELLLASGADPTIADSKHQGDAAGWAEFFGDHELARRLREGGR